MVKVKIGMLNFDTDDKVGKCLICDGDMFSAPEYVNYFNFTDDQILQLELGIIDIRICPICYEIFVVTR